MTNLRAIPALLMASIVACSPGSDAGKVPGADVGPAVSAGGGQAAVQDDESQPNVVKIALGSKDHTTLVAGLQAADLVNSLANAGPFTVFAPTNEAFGKLPLGALDDLLKPENKSKLTTILHHHVTTSALDMTDLEDGQSLSMVDGVSETISRKDGASWIGGAKVIASVRASNGWVHIIDRVLLPTPK